MHKADVLVVICMNCGDATEITSEHVPTTLSAITGWGCKVCNANGRTEEDVNALCETEVNPTIFWTMSSFGKQKDGRYLFGLNSVRVLDQYH